MLQYCFFRPVGQDSVEKWINNRQFVFHADWIDPLRGRARFLTGGYDLTVKSDSLFSYLPYAGRSDIAPLSSDDAGFIFNTTKFDYNVSAGKKKSWIVTMNVSGQTYLSRFYLTVYSNGTAQLSTTSSFRDPVSFRGHIGPLRQKN